MKTKIKIIVVQAHCQKLGYKIFNEQNYTKQLFSAWEEVKSFETTTLEIDAFKFDREKGGLIPEDQYRTY